MKTNQEHEKNITHEKKAARQKQGQPATSERQLESHAFRSRRAFLGLGKVTAALRSRRADYVDAPRDERTRSAA